MVPRQGSACPHSGIAPWARREGPSLAQRGYPGIHAGMPTAQCLRSASVVNGASQIKIKIKIKIKIRIRSEAV
ncbi:nucleoid-structuring protein H-NS [Pseudomonas sp. FP198]|uniref:nucleoid-structuring protein H-NS n=1 Tax=Pseudomonas sp. FP198 TaxID=2954084 RepID=UPI0027346B63|nr:nucleoid-structuring protein H-NS [Pseudomonas sp. FP198]WLG98528.1 nucleoid-structuring protein H-NS [Pseudomonas sp. FP198]